MKALIVTLGADGSLIYANGKQIVIALTTMSPPFLLKWFYARNP